jgi:hypothetical protein
MCRLRGAVHRRGRSSAQRVRRHARVGAALAWGYDEREAGAVQEAVYMEFSMICPNDGVVDVGLENVASIVVRGDETLEVVFACPRCGADLKVLAQVPKMLLATLEDAVVVDEETGEHVVSIDGLVQRGLLPPEVAGAMQHTAEPQADEEMIDRYCEYFRRQLASTTSVEAMLAEIDSK